LQRRITGIAAPGGYAEYMRAKASHAIKIPDGLGVHEAAPYLCAGVTMYHACKDAGVGPGQDVAVFGVGGLGHLAIQFAKQLGATTAAVDLSDEKLELARSLGADRTIDASSPDAAKQIAAHGGVHVAVVTAPSEKAFGLALQSLRLRGTLTVVGLPKRDLTFLADDLVTGEYRIVGSAVGTREDLRAALELAVTGQVRCQVETVPLEKINEALRRMRDGEVAGRAVITF
jgi:propanol-preferring alcohol dehydrogenase